MAPSQTQNPRQIDPQADDRISHPARQGLIGELVRMQTDKAPIVRQRQVYHIHYQKKYAYIETYGQKPAAPEPLCQGSQSGPTHREGKPAQHGHGPDQVDRPEPVSGPLKVECPGTGHRFGHRLIHLAAVDRGIRLARTRREWVSRPAPCRCEHQDVYKEQEREDLRRVDGSRSSIDRDQLLWRCLLRMAF